MDRNTVRGEKWGLHPISARTSKDETSGEASSRWNLPGAFAQFRSGSSPGRPKGRPGCFPGARASRSNLAILSEVMASGAELIRQIKEQIEEVDPKEVHEVSVNGHGNGSGPVIVDVREQHEFEQSHLPGAVHVPRGHLESRIEGAVGSDRSKRVILYCATGQRSALAAHTLQELLGYEDVASMRGGITLWKDRGYDVEVPRALTPEQRERYSRHVLVPEIGLEGQMKLLDAKVLLLGAGGLGSPAALYLAAAGVGTLGIVDNDVVDLSNLQRQVAHSNDRIGMPKVDSAEISIHEINPEVNVVKHSVRIDATNIMDILPGYDVVIDGLDNFPTRYLLNDASVRLG